MHPECWSKIAYKRPAQSWQHTGQARSTEGLLTRARQRMKDQNGQRSSVVLSVGLVRVSPGRCRGFIQRRLGLEGLLTSTGRRTKDQNGLRSSVVLRVGFVRVSPGRYWFHPEYTDQGLALQRNKPGFKQT